MLDTLLKHLWQEIYPEVILSKMLQAWHTCYWAVSHIFVCRTCQTPSGWMGSVGPQPFSVFFRDIKSGSSLGSGWATKDIHRVVPKPILCYPGCVLWFVVLLEYEPSPKSKVQCYGAGYHQGCLSILLILSLPWSYLVSHFFSFYRKISPLHGAGTAVLCCRNGIGQVMSSTCFLPNMMLGIQPSFSPVFVSLDQMWSFLIVRWSKAPEGL